MHQFTIGKAARQAGVTLETIRFYERKGLIERPSRPQRSFRHYSMRIVAQVRFIKQAQRLGFSLREVRGLLDLWGDAEADCADVRERAAMKLNEVQGKIVRLQEIELALDDLIERCPREGALKGCPIIETLAHSAERPTE